MRGWITLLLIFGFFIIFYSVTGQEVQSQVTAFLLGIFIGILIGWATGGWRILRKLRREEHEKVDTTFDQRKEKHL